MNNNSSSNSLPSGSNIALEIPRELLGTLSLEGRQSAAKPLKEDSDYWILEDGRLYSLKANRFLSGKIDNSGYLVYSLAITNHLTGKKGKMLYAHRLVAEYFLDKPEDEERNIVNHIDENKLNNNRNNLEWVTFKENRLHYLKGKKFETKPPKYKIDNLENEEWKVILEKPQYSVSNYGRVINNQTNRLLRFETTKGGYQRISLSGKHYYVHRLVYCTFHNDYDLESYVIDHIDAKRDNNRLDNLQKITPSENSLRKGSTTIRLGVESSDSKCEAPTEVG